MKDETHKSAQDEDESLAQLLREVGARDAPSTDVQNEVRQAAHAEWRAVVSQRQRRKSMMRYGIAAGIAVAAIATTVSLQFLSEPQPIGAVARAEGTLEAALDSRNEWRSLPAGSSLTGGTMLRTDAESRAALDLGHGVSLRIDASSLVRLTAANRIALEEGAAYVDANPRMQADPQAATLVIDTPYGSVRHLGTQYEVRSVQDGIAVSVREGRVEVLNADRRYQGTAGEQLVIGQQGVTRRTAVAPHDARWQWATNIAPVFEIERQPLSLFLDWAAREIGKDIEYADPEVRARAEQLILRGSVRDLAPEQALAAVLATTPFTQSQTQSAIRIQLQH